MKREIKFRAWINIEEWTGYYYQGDIHAYIQFLLFQDGFSVVDCNDEYLKDSEFIIEQYTGLKDKNGVEYYCGDYASDGKRVFEIRMVDGGFCICPFKDNDWRFYESIHDMQTKGYLTESCTNIGNIHEAQNENI